MYGRFEDNCGPTKAETFFIQDYIKNVCDYFKVKRSLLLKTSSKFVNEYHPVLLDHEEIQIVKSLKFLCLMGCIKKSDDIVMLDNYIRMEPSTTINGM